MCTATLGQLATRSRLSSARTVESKAAFFVSCVGKMRNVVFVFAFWLAAMRRTSASGSSEQYWFT